PLPTQQRRHLSRPPRRTRRRGASDRAGLGRRRSPCFQQEVPPDQRLSTPDHGGPTASATGRAPVPADPSPSPAASPAPVPLARGPAPGNGTGPPRRDLPPAIGPPPRARSAASRAPLHLPPASSGP